MPGEDHGNRFVNAGPVQKSKSNLRNAQSRPDSRHAARPASRQRPESRESFRAHPTIDTQMCSSNDKPDQNQRLSPHEIEDLGTAGMDAEDRGLGSQDVAQQFCKILTDCGRGSLLRGWRNELDPDCRLSLSIPELCKAAGRLRFSENVELMYGIDGDFATFSLEELAPDHAAALDRFKVWVKDCVGGPFKFMEAICAEGDLCPPLSIFKSFVKSRGFVATDYALHELFCMCDPGFHGYLRQDDNVFLECDPVTRDLEHFKIKTRHKDQRQRYLATVYNIDRNLQVPAHHRLAPRAWNQTKFEKLPTVIAQRREKRSKELRRQSFLAFAQFTRELREQHGSEIKAWRRVMDPDGTFILTQAKLKRYCRQMHSGVDVAALWRHVDSDCHGSIGIDEFCPQSSMHLAAFHSWAHRYFGSCVGMWSHLDIKSCSSWPSAKNMMVSAFGFALRGLGWPLAGKSEARNAVIQALDVRACGFVVKADLEWLDRWNPPAWMCSDPDPAAWNELFALFTKKYKHPLAAWRRALDTDDSNHISWAEFKRACDKMKFQGNVGGAWRALDQDLSGYVSMHEFDKQSADILTSFKSWVDTNFGSVCWAFKAWDRDGSATVSLLELQRVCQEYRWQGDVLELFHCLDADHQRDAAGENSGKASLTLAELSFLDNWRCELADEKREDTELIAGVRTPQASVAGSRPGTRGSNRRPSPSQRACSAQRGQVSNPARTKFGPTRQRTPTLTGDASSMSAVGAWTGPEYAWASSGESSSWPSPVLSKSKSAPAVKPYVSPYAMPV